MNAILVPIDFSENSKRAVDYAVSLARSMKLKLLLVHVAQSENEFQETIKKKELELWALAVRTAESIDCESLFYEGEFLEKMPQIIEEEQIEFVVMATKGASGIKGKFVGSISASVVEFVSCPVIVVPDEFRFRGLRKIVFASDYHDSDLDSIKFIVDLCKQFKAELKIVHFENEDFQERFEEDLMELFKEKVKGVIHYEKIDYCLIKGSGIHESLNEFVIKEGADMLALSMNDRFFKGAMFNTGLTRKFVQHSSVPVLAFHAFDEGGFYF